MGNSESHESATLPPSSQTKTLQSFHLDALIQTCSTAWKEKNLIIVKITKHESPEEDLRLQTFVQGESTHLNMYSCLLSQPLVQKSKSRK